jgi:hypothetical protein
MMQLRAVLGTVETLFMTAAQFNGVVECFDSLHDLIRVLKYKETWSVTDLQDLEVEITR